MSTEPITGTFYDHATGLITERELTDEEIVCLSQPVELPDAE
jgi:hypothetical protein